jgi:hypothetical protein
MTVIKKSELKILIFNRLLLIVFLLPFFGGFVLYYFHSGFSVCMLMNLTGLPCPACGLTRAFQELSHLHFIEAIQYNISILIISPVIFFFLIIQLLPINLKKKVYFFLNDNIKSFNLILTILFIIFILLGFLRIFDKFFHFINFKDITPDKILINFVTDK